MHHLDYNPAALTFTPLELHEHPDYDRIAATVAEGCEGEGALHLIRDIVIEVEEDGLVHKSYSEGVEQGYVDGIEAALDTVSDLLHYVLELPERVIPDPALKEVTTLIEECKDRLHEMATKGC